MCVYVAIHDMCAAAYVVNILMMVCKFLFFDHVQNFFITSVT